MNYKIVNDLVYDLEGNLIIRARYDEETDKVYDIADLNIDKFYIDENGIKHIKKYNENWQELKCKWNDELVFDNGKWRIKTEQEKLEEYKQQLIHELKNYAYKYIITYYPLWKQNNDLSDKESIVVSIFNGSITTDDIRKSIYNIFSGKSDVYTELVRYGVKAGFIKTDENGLPLYEYLLKDNSKMIANINREYKNKNGEIKIIPEDQIIDRNLIFSENVDKNVINTAVVLAKQLIKIAKRIIWKDSVREKVNELEIQIKNAKTFEELNSIDFSVIEIPYDDK